MTEKPHCRCDGIDHGHPKNECTVQPRAVGDGLCQSCSDKDDGRYHPAAEQALEYKNLRRTEPACTRSTGGRLFSEQLTEGPIRKTAGLFPPSKTRHGRIASRAALRL